MCNDTGAGEACIWEESLSTGDVWEEEG